MTMAKPSLAERVDALVSAELTKIKDPTARALAANELAEALPAIGGTVRAMRADAIRTLRRQTPPPTWDAIGTILGVTRQRAEQLARTTLEEAMRA
jgi:DNA-directed RNA polymerase sigma subunit (sigma70/sigma32)